mgnify:FL=1
MITRIKKAKHAMILSAGLGTRMLPYSRNIPKPLLKVGGKTLLDGILDKLEDVGIKKIIINSYHLSHKLIDHIEKRGEKKIHVVVEKKLLGTGGGVKNVLNHLLPGPFLVLNSDVIWIDQKDNFFHLLSNCWDGRKMDALLLLYPVSRKPDENLGDYRKDGNGRIYRRKGLDFAPYVFTGAQILHDRLFKKSPRKPFSLVNLYDRAEKSGRLFGLVYNGIWHDVGTKDKLRRIRKKIRML